MSERKYEVTTDFARCVVMNENYFWNNDPAPRDVMARCLECTENYGNHLKTCSWSK